MSAYTLDCPPLDSCGPCGTLPPGFVRLRYFFGKRMGVADFLDEQRYHAGKLRFHNQHLHGAGLLCGLGVALQSPTDVILRVGKGAALDDCGREIIVGYDQCIDLDAWYQRVAAERRASVADWPVPVLDANGNLPLIVAIRYRECASTPEPAPRDTCSCDAAGCDFGRVREEFELDLFLPGSPELDGVAPMVPPRADLDRVLGRAFGESSLGRELATAATAPYPDSEGTRWIPLASLAAQITPAPSATEIGHVTKVIEPITVVATLLAETALIQEILLRDAGAHLEAGSLAGGPEITRLVVERDGSSAFYWLSLELDGPVIEQTVPTDAFTVSRLATSGTPGWTAIPAKTDYVAPTATTPAKLRVRVENAGNALVKDGLYRIALDTDAVPAATPIVDDKMRPLIPLKPVVQFSLDEPTPGAFAYALPPYAR